MSCGRGIVALVTRSGLHIARIVGNAVGVAIDGARSAITGTGSARRSIRRRLRRRVIRGRRRIILRGCTAGEADQR